MHTLHLPLGVDNDACIVLEIDEDTVLPPPGLPLANHHSWQHCTHMPGLRTRLRCPPGHICCLKLLQIKCSNARPRLK